MKSTGASDTGIDNLLPGESNEPGLLAQVTHTVRRRALAVAVMCAVMGQAWAAETDSNESGDREQSENIEQVIVEGTRVKPQATARLPLTAKEIPQSVSLVTRDFMDLTAITDINDVMMNVTGVNVSLYDTQRPLYFSRGFQITDFQVDGIPTYSGSTNQEYDTALYERVEVIRGANGLFTGVGAPSATVNLIRKRPEKDFGAAISATAGSWNMRRVVGDVSVPLTSDGSVRSRFVVAHQDSDSFRDRYREDKTAVLGTIEADITSQSTVAIGYQNQDNNPEGTIWGTIPLFASDGSRARLPVSTSYAPEWTKWQRESSTVFADVNHKFNERWTLRAAVSRTEGEVESLRVYATGFPDRETGRGLTLRAGVGAGEETRDSLDLQLTGSYSAFGRLHDLVIGGNASELDERTADISASAWAYEVPNAWDYDGKAPKPEYSRTGGYERVTTEQSGIYVANRFRFTNRLSILGGLRVSTWETSESEVQYDNELTPYLGAVYDLTSNLSFYASYTDIFSPQTLKDRHKNYLDPLLGVNMEAGIKAELLDEQLIASFALFKTSQDNFAVRDPELGDTPIDDEGTYAYIAVDGTESQGIEMNLSGQLSDGWTINTGYTYVDTNRREEDRIWTNLPEHSVQLSTHYQLPGALENLIVGGGFNWQSETIGYGVTHPLVEEGVTYKQGSYVLANLYATWKFNEHLNATLSATNLFDKVYWANIDYANYGEPRNVQLALRWQL